METDQQIINRLSKRFPCIVKWGRYLGSYDYYIANELLRAEEDNAPTTAYNHNDPNGWDIAENIKNPDIRKLILL